jgi:uncharacterized protein CbrC (UPF0167 family)
MAYSSGHKMGAIVSQPIRCENCTHKRAILYSSGVLYCWHCKHLKGA